METPTIFAAVFLGAASFLSPCVLPLVPGYLSTITGLSLTEIETTRKRQVMVPALLFCMSFTLLFTVLGMTATGLGQTLDTHGRTLELISGALVALFGVAIIATAWLPALGRSNQVGWLLDRAGVSPIIAGAAFAVAWTPCAGPTLGAILSTAYSADTVGTGGLLLAGYGAGLAIPFLLCAFALQRVLGPMRWIARHHKGVAVVSGSLLITLGLLVATGQMMTVTTQLTRGLNDLGLGFFSNL